MPITLHCDIPLTAEEVSALWQTVIKNQGSSDGQIGIDCVSEEAIRQLNKQYRGKDKATNILTFSYDTDQHDVAICLSVAKKESDARGTTERDYIALLLTHAFLHAVGLDHELSDKAKLDMEQAEKAVLAQCGFAAESL